MIRNSVAELRLALDEQTPVHRRQTMRAYGVVFVGDSTDREATAVTEASETEMVSVEQEAQEMPEPMAQPEPASTLEQPDEEWLSTIAARANRLEPVLNGHSIN